ncbi:aldehyde dehydrogenase family protein [Kribbella sp. NPDC050820]|uniref:aldehyde dehydrogenase family protein n=1 Tax=Kribbella sp. NPDC050820 TaxID=3155408 RepID=UPI0033D91926
MLGGVPQDAHILSQEIFGPVAPVVAYDDLEEAIALANNTEYGLVSYVYTRDLRTGPHVRGCRCDNTTAGATPAQFTPGARRAPPGET